MPPAARLLASLSSLSSSLSFAFVLPLAGCGAVRTGSAPRDAGPPPPEAAVPVDAGISVDASPAPCGDGGWCWESPVPQGEALTSVWLRGPTSGWAVGGRGALLRLGPSGWALQPPPTADDLSGLWGAESGSSPEDMWAVSTGATTGALVHWDGAAWTSMTPGGANYASLTGSASDDVWVLTWTQSDVRALRWDGTAWSPATPPPPQYQFDSLCVRGKNDVWATASVATVSSFPTVVLRWDGASWTQVYAVDGLGLQRFDSNLGCASVSGASSDVWGSVYDFNAEERWLVRWNGTAWAKLSIPAGVSSIDELHYRFTQDGGFTLITTGYGGGAFAWDGASFVDQTPTSVSGQRLPVGDLDFWLHPDSGQLVGWLATGSDLVPWSLGAAGYIAPGWDTREVVVRDVISEFAGAPGGAPGFAVGQTGTLATRDAATATWSESPVGDASAPRVAAAWSADGVDVWTASAGTVTRWRTGTATPFALSTVSVVALSGTAPNDVWALDENGTIHVWDGGAWSVRADTVAQTIGGAMGANVALSGLWVHTATDAWAIGNDDTEVGTRGAAIHWDGTTWSPAWLGDGATAWNTGWASVVAGAPSGDAWIAGSYVWHLGSDGTWSQMTAAGEVTTRALQISPSGVYWLPGGTQAQVVTRLDPVSLALTTWTIPVSKQFGIGALWVGANAPGGADVVWVGGANGAVLRYGPASGS